MSVETTQLNLSATFAWSQFSPQESSRVSKGDKCVERVEDFV